MDHVLRRLKNKDTVLNKQDTHRVSPTKILILFFFHFQLSIAITQTPDFQLANHSFFGECRSKTSKKKKAKKKERINQERKKPVSITPQVFSNLDSSVRGVFIFSPASLHFHKQKTKKKNAEKFLRAIVVR
jgi:hypothetical protein